MSAPGTVESIERTPGQVAGSAIGGFIIGAAGGAALGGSLDGVGAVWGALIGGVAVGVSEAVTDARRSRGMLKPLWNRILSSVFIAAIIGWLVGLVLPDWSPVVYGAGFGLLFGAFGARLQKLLIGLAVGLVVGLSLEALYPEAAPPVVAAFVALAYRVVAAVVYRGRPQVKLMAESVAADDVEYVVPFAAEGSYVGVDYLEEYAERTGADFDRNPEDIGIVATFDELAGPSFDVQRVNPLVREFYEHTSRFHLSIRPEWKTWMKPVYLAYRSVVARPLGQANAPFEIDEVQEGVVSWIDTIDVDHTGSIDFRAWVRAYEATREPIYVGIYTVQRHEGVGLVSVGFPLPNANFSATLLPNNNKGDGLLLRSKGHPFAGHYLSAIEGEGGQLTTLKLLNFNEEIDVYVEDGELLTDHRFFLGGVSFLTLFYTIERI